MGRASIFTPKPTGLLLNAPKPVVKSSQFLKREGKKDLLRYLIHSLTPPEKRSPGRQHFWY